MAGIGESKHRIRPKLQQVTEQRPSSVPFALTPSEFLSRGETTGYWGIPSVTCGLLWPAPTPNFCCCLQAQVTPLTVIHVAFCGDNRESAFRWRGPEPARKVPSHACEVQAQNQVFSKFQVE